MYALPVVDTHVHLYDVERLQYSWLGNIPQLNRTFLLDDYAAAVGTAPIEQFVFVEVAAHADDALKEARWVDSHCAVGRIHHGIRAQGPAMGAIVAQARVELGAAVEDDLSMLLEIQRVTGIRRIVAAPFQTDPAFCLRPLFVEGVKRLSEHNLSFDIGAPASYLPAVIQFARQCDDVRLVLDHLGMPLIKDAIMEPWRQQIRELAAMPHVYCKISGLLSEAGEKWSVSAIAPYVLEAVNAFGFDRIMFGSDFPVQNLVGSFTVWFDMVSSILGGASQEELRRFFCDNARRVYRISAMPARPRGVTS
jgi:L-fuconolactonase